MKEFLMLIRESADYGTLSIARNPGLVTIRPPVWSGKIPIPYKSRN